jgi:hypothetical protein
MDMDRAEAEPSFESEGELQQSDIYTQSDAYDSSEDGGSVAMDTDSPSVAGFVVPYKIT